MNIAKIYLDSVRSFEETAIPIKSINFFIGENSTGKTSVLKLINLIASDDFWFKSQFANDNVDFSYYKDLSDMTETCRIAVLLEPTPYEKIKPAAAYFEFKAGINGQTIIDNFKFANSEFEINVRTLEDDIKYIVESSSFSKSSFESWCELGVKEAQDLGSYGKEAGDIRRYFFGPYFLINFLLEHYQRKNISTSKKKIRSPKFQMFINADYRWIAPIRVKPKNIYDKHVYNYSAEGAHIPFSIRDMLIEKDKGKKTNIAYDALINFGKKSGLFDNIVIQNYGDDGDSPFAIKLELDNVARKLTDVGYGVSQILPVAVELLNGEAMNVAIQQPEVHLHPKAQAAFGELVFDILETKSSSKLLIETHSDYIIDRFRQKMSSNLKSGRDSQVVFFERSGHKNVAHIIPIEKNGKYSIKQPQHFRDFFYKEAINNIKI